MKGGGSGSSTTTTTVPPEFSRLASRTGDTVADLQSGPASLFPFTAADPKYTPGLDPLQQQATSLIPSIGAAPRASTDAATLANNAANLDFNPSKSFSELMNDPSIQAQQQAFEALSAPGIQQHANLAGLGRSTAVDKGLATGEAAALVPTVQGALNRAQQGQFAKAGTMEASASQLAGLGNVETGRNIAEVNALNQAGAQNRNIAEEAATNEQQDMLRRQALAEEATFGPLGQLVPSTFGQFTKGSSTGGGK